MGEHRDCAQLDRTRIQKYVIQEKSIMLFDYFKLSIGSYDERLFLTFSAFFKKEIEEN